MALPSPNPRAYPDVHDCGAGSPIMPTLDMEKIRDKPLLNGTVDLLRSSENQPQLPTIVVDTSMAVNSHVADANEGITFRNSDHNLLEIPLTVIAAKTPSSVYYTDSSLVQTAQGPVGTSVGTFHYIAGNTKNLRGTSIDELRLGPKLREGVSILVESDGIVRSFLVHTELLCHYSPFFRSIFAKRDPKVFSKEINSFSYTNELDFDQTAHDQAEGGKVEVQIKVNMPTTTALQSFRLPSTLGDVKHAEFTAFIEWLYLGPQKLGQIGGPDAGQLLIKLWVLAGRLGVPSCQNDCIVAIEYNRRRSRTISTSMIGWVYEHTADYGKNQCGLRNMLIDQCALALDEKSLLEEMQAPEFAKYFPMECLFDIFARLKALLKESCLGVGVGSLTIDPKNRRYRNDIEENNTY